LIHSITIVAVPVQFSLGGRYSRCINNQLCFFIQQRCIVSTMDIHPLGLHGFCQFGFCTVITAHLHSLLREEAGQNAHAYAAYAYKIYPFQTVNIHHTVLPLISNTFFAILSSASFIANARRLSPISSCIASFFNNFFNLLTSSVLASLFFTIIAALCSTNA